MVTERQRERLRAVWAALSERPQPRDAELVRRFGGDREGVTWAKIRLFELGYIVLDPACSVVQVIIPLTAGRIVTGVSNEVG